VRNAEQDLGVVGEKLVLGHICFISLEIDCMIRSS
jgi:hypothetical protein